MNKKLIVIQCPIATRSGYGERSRDIVRSLLPYEDEYEIKIVPTRWGSTPMNALDEAKDAEIINAILTEPLTRQPDVYIQITVPNEFQQFGKFNIGITAGIETTIAPISWVEGCNKMDLVLCSSTFSKEVLEKTLYTKVNNQTNQQESVMKIETPIEVLFEGINTELYTKIYNKSPRVVNTFKKIKEDFCYLFVGHWLQGDLGEDRKNVGLLIQNFLETFKDVKNPPALILKTSGGAYSNPDKHDVVQKMEAIKETVSYKKQLPSIYLLYGDFEDTEMNDLYNHPKVKCHISFTKGEGFGRPLLEAAMSNKPVICSGWSGHMDFIKPEYNCVLPGVLTPIHPSVQNPFLIKEAQWFSVDVNAASQAIQDVFKNYKAFEERSRKNNFYLKKEFPLEKMGLQLKSILDKNTIQHVPFQLPKLRKVE